MINCFILIIRVPAFVQYNNNNNNNNREVVVAIVTISSSLIKDNNRVAVGRTNDNSRMIY